MRLNRFIAALGICSRRKADELILSGQVLINGKKPEQGVQVGGLDKVTVSGVTYSFNNLQKNLTWAFHKPAGVICTMNPKERPNLLDCVPIEERFFAVGRLDRESEGLLILTTDGDLAQRLAHPSFAHEKEYQVTTREVPTPAQLEAMRSGLLLEDGMTQPCTVEPLGNNSFRMVLTEGKNRQIRRMCLKVGLHVQRLLRVRVGGLVLRQAQGKLTLLSEAEISLLNQGSDE